MVPALVAVLSLAAAADAPAATRALRVAVPEVRVSGEVDPRHATYFEQALLAETRKLAFVSAIGVSEIKQILAFEYQRQMMGCAADEQCLAEIAGALGVDEMVHAVLASTGTSYAVTAKRISLKGAKVVGQAVKVVRKIDGEELLGTVGPLVAELFPDRSLRAGQVRGVERELVLRLNPPPLPPSVFLATATGVVVTVAAGGVFAYLAMDSRSSYQQLAEQSRTQPVPGSAFRSLQDDIDSRARTANILFGTAAVLGAACVVEAFFTDWHGYRTAPAAPAVRAAPVASGGPGLTVVASF
jgi:hypothetical protein